MDTARSTDVATNNADLVYQTILSVLENECINVKCKRAKQFQDSGKELIQACQEHPDNFNRFCDKLVKQER